MSQLATEITKPAQDAPRNRDQMGGLLKGLRLLECFDAAHARMTLSQAAVRAGISPASARRCLLTLCDAGYARSDGKYFWLGHGALRIAHAYAASTGLPRLLQPALDALSEKTRESASLSVLDGHAVVIAARSTARRTLRLGLGVGSHLPLYCSAAGRVLMAWSPVAQWTQLVSATPMERLTAHTEVTVAGLTRLLQACRETGYATCDEEIELGVRSIAIPLYRPDGSIAAAMSISTRAERLTTSDMVSQFLPTMLRSQDWARSRIKA